MNAQRRWLGGDKAVRRRSGLLVGGLEGTGGGGGGVPGASLLPTPYMPASPHAYMPTCLHACMHTCHGRTNPGIGRVQVLVRPWISQGRQRRGRTLNRGGAGRGRAGQGRAGRGATEDRGFLNEAKSDASSSLGLGFGLGQAQEGGEGADEGEVML
jgi:hypothetical protein